jgi:hypothetical protein
MLKNASSSLYLLDLSHSRRVKVGKMPLQNAMTAIEILQIAVVYVP